jgi:hypothetical protein
MAEVRRASAVAIVVAAALSACTQGLYHAPVPAVSSQTIPGSPEPIICPADGKPLPPGVSCVLPPVDEATARIREQEAIRHQDEERATLLEAAHRAQAHPSPALAAYEAKMTPVLTTSGLALAALYCHLRSQAWFSAFSVAIPVLSDREAMAAHLSPTERGAADLFSQGIEEKIVQRIVGNTGGACPDLVNSPTMDHLDRVQWGLTGGYH